MRVLKFIVDDVTIRQDPTCDFDGLFPGMEEQVLAEFAFSPEWENRIKVAAFLSIMDTEYEPQVVNDNKTCMIPLEALNKVAFKVQIIGKRRGGATVKTNAVTVYQSGRKR